MTGVLARILASKRVEIDALRARVPSAPSRPTCDVASALRKEGALAIIAEVKFKSPSAGPLSRALGAGERAVAYARAGASMVSVLCDEPFFDGSYDDVAKARAALDASGFANVPVLAKEFVLDEAQLDRAREAGADAALVIATILPGEELAKIVAACRARALEPFVEIVDERELARALDASARVIGVNTRDLDTLAMDAERAVRVLGRIPDACVAVHLSGLRGADDVASVAASRADAALVGEALMRADDPSDILKRMLARAAK
jgi:indole-3-glycerol phosphate synthase